ncbi:response regulator transcription factor [Streptomyces sp. NPDC019645]|uniref:response regulator transcription factor n=1 Tax=unclassified Streptomyces TaxID=2593676 RepID=UPI0033CC481F
MRVAVVEDQPLLQDVLAEGLTSRGLTVVGRARDATGALLFLERTEPEVVLLDIRLPPGYSDEGLCLAETVRARYPAVGLLVLSSYAELHFAQRLLGMQEDARAVGYVLKERVGDLGELIEAIRRVAAGEVVVDRHLINRLMSRQRTSDPLERLSPHERRILALVAEGRSNLGIAEQMACRVSTVEKHLSSITAKLDLAPIGEATRRGVNVRVLATLAFLRTVDSGAAAAEGPR